MNELQEYCGAFKYKIKQVTDQIKLHQDMMFKDKNILKWRALFQSEFSFLVSLEFKQHFWQKRLKGTGQIYIRPTAVDSKLKQVKSYHIANQI